MHLRHLLIMSLFPALLACPGSPEKEADVGSPWDTTVPAPDGDAPDMPESDGSSPGRDSGTDTGPPSPDLGPAPSCDGRFPLDPDACNPTVTGECPEDGYCSFAIVGTPPPQLACLPRSDEGDGRAGTACQGVRDCREGLTCVDWTIEIDPRGQECTRYCELESGRGCGDREFCTTNGRLPPADGIGVCAPACDPYERDSCGPGETCAPDYNYPDQTCQPHFRCVSVSGDGLEGDACGPGDGLARCSTGLTCYDTGTDEHRCVQPCRADADCDGSCGAAVGPWRLRYCDM